MISLHFVVFDYTGNSDNKRQRKPTKRLLESTEDYEQIFVQKNKKSKKNTSESSSMVR